MSENNQLETSSTLKQITARSWVPIRVSFARRSPDTTMYNTATRGNHVSAGETVFNLPYFLNVRTNRGLTWSMKLAQDSWEDKVNTDVRKICSKSFLRLSRPLSLTALALGAESNIVYDRDELILSRGGNEPRLFHRITFHSGGQEIIDFKVVILWAALRRTVAARRQYVFCSRLMLSYHERDCVHRCRMDLRSIDEMER